MLKPSENAFVEVCFVGEFILFPGEGKNTLHVAQTPEVFD